MEEEGREGLNGRRGDEKGEGHEEEERREVVTFEWRGKACGNSYDVGDGSRPPHTAPPPTPHTPSKGRFFFIV